MIYLVYLALVPISLVLTLIAVILAPVLPIFSQEREGWVDNQSMWDIGPRLPIWLNWFMTPDNSLDGDSTFLMLNLPSYWHKVKWLLRNPAYSFAIRYLIEPKDTKVYGDPTIKDNDKAKEGWCLVLSASLFQFRIVKRLFGTSRCLYCNFGWNIMALAGPNVITIKNPYMATFVFSPRISGFR